MIIDLNGDWQLFYVPEKRGVPEEYSPGMEHQWEQVPAVVPGNVELDLMRSGIESDPFYSTNLHD